MPMEVYRFSVLCLSVQIGTYRVEIMALFMGVVLGSIGYNWFGKVRFWDFGVWDRMCPGFLCIRACQGLEGFAVPRPGEP